MPGQSSIAAAHSQLNVLVLEALLMVAFELASLCQVLLNEVQDETLRITRDWTLSLHPSPP